MFTVTLKSSLYYVEVMTSPFDHIFMGHFARDTIIAPNGETSNSLGGGVTFGTLTAHNFNKTRKIGVFSEIGKDFNFDWFDIFNHKIDLMGVRANSRKSTNFQIEYFEKGGRQLVLKSQAKPLQFSKIPFNYLSAKSYIISSIANEISYDFIKRLVDETEGWIGIDIQGFIREFNDDGTIKTEPALSLIENMHKIFQYCGERLVIKASGEEINYVAENDDVIESTKLISNLGDFLVCTTLGPDGSLIKRKGQKLIHIPAFLPVNGVVDETGAGDCYLSAFVCELLNSEDPNNTSLKRCGYIASSAASFNLEHKGPKGFGTFQDIIQRIEMGKTIPSQFENIIKNMNL
jgi:hypothetical protein